jgi:hypothetical protein
MPVLSQCKREIGVDSAIAIAVELTVMVRMRVLVKRGRADMI